MFSRRYQPTACRRVTAILGVALVVLLSILEVSPELHAWIHGYRLSAGGGRVTDDSLLTSPTPGDSGHHSGPDHQDGADHVCAVTIFASGLILLVCYFPLLRAQPFAYRIFVRDAFGLAAARPRYWHVPAHAPPLV